MFFIRRRRGLAVCGAGANASSWRAPSHRPASTQLTGTCSAERGRDERRDVERSVLLGAEHLLALVEQDRDVERVVDDQVVHARPAAELLHGRALLDGLGERDVAHRRRAIGDQREHRERPDDGRLGYGDLDGEVGRECRHDGLLLALSSSSVSRAPSGSRPDSASAGSRAGVGVDGATVRQLRLGLADSTLCRSAAVTFQPLPDHELHQLADEQLIAYIRDARDAGELAHGTPRPRCSSSTATSATSSAACRSRCPAHVVDDLAHDALVRAIAAAFDGSSVGEFRSWLHTIVDRTAVDFFRRAERRPKETLLPSEHAGEDDVWGAEPSIESEAGAVELRIIVEEVLETFNEKHRLVIELHVFDGLTAAEVCDRIEGMSEDNVAQIASRFRAKLRARLDPGGGP